MQLRWCIEFNMQKWILIRCLILYDEILQYSKELVKEIAKTSKYQSRVCEQTNSQAINTSRENHNDGYVHTQ